MKPLDQPEELQAYYRTREVVEAYLRRRTGQPLNGFLHRAQVAFLNRALAEARPRRVLEIAPGPGRLTAEVRLPEEAVGVGVDASPAMLRVARDRVPERRWGFLQGDAFALPFPAASFDLVYTLKFVRHFQLDNRRRLYAEIRRVLAPGGHLVLDAQNRRVSLPHRLEKGLDRYPIYDVLYVRGELEAELEAAGFEVVRVEGVLRHFFVQQRLNRLRRVGLARLARGLIGWVERLPGTEPSTWMVLARNAGSGGRDGAR